MWNQVTPCETQVHKLIKFKFNNIFMLLLTVI